MCRQNAGSDPVDLLWAQCDLTDRLLSTLTSFSSSLSVISSRRPRPLRKYRRFDTWLKTMAELLAQWFLLQYRRVLKPLPLWMLLDIWENSQATCASKRCSTQVASLFFLSLSRKKTHTHTHRSDSLLFGLVDSRKKKKIWYLVVAPCAFSCSESSWAAVNLPCVTFFFFLFSPSCEFASCFQSFFFFLGEDSGSVAQEETVSLGVD